MRALHRLYAKVNGFFWMPCPVCGRMFGGHEIAGKHVASWVSKNATRHVVCPDPECSHDAAVMNMMNGYTETIRKRR